MNLRLRIEVLIEVCVTVGRVYGDCSTTQPAICVWRTHLHRRERGGGNGYVRSATTNQGYADQLVGVGVVVS